MASTALGGTHTFRAAPPQRALKAMWVLVSSNFSTARGLMLSTICPSCTYCVGTTSPSAEDSSTIYGVISLSTIHSYWARMRLCRLDVMSRKLVLLVEEAPEGAA